MDWIDSIISFLLPSYCIGCHDRLSKEHAHICDTCFELLPRYEGMETFYHPHDRIEGFVPFSEIRSDLIFTEHSTVRKLIHRIKYEGYPDLGYRIAKHFAMRHLELAHFSDVSAIIPVPITYQRLWSRGYNQSKAIAQGIADAYGLPIVEEALKRTSGSTQTNRDKVSRWEAMGGVFSGKSGVLEGRRVLLVDDVLTSGATVVHAAKALYDDCKVESVSVYTLALDVYL
ncbi:ComF family protein [Porphyromonas sp.]|uniref:ComF family protein n=1 Tax=Porphyromonas sp. TaxID=1924944 RepID=UPI0026DC6761|nr:phosphoribosyltransferase family protein [Porphyromonas sp.]MDO4695675.1 phosphoribosyltransferase family protein [Porphyromonas sp.]MDO4771501.1 phosphoribosyltransferase family protein [Porphyromonas sp.]